MPIAPVLAIVVCHDGEVWLPLGLSALRRGTVTPRHVVAVDTGSADRTPDLLTHAAEEGLVDEVITLPADTGFADAVARAVEHAHERFDEADDWIWVLHDDCAPEQECLATLLNATAASPSAGVLGPIAVDWADPRLIVEAGLSTDASGNRRTDIGLGGSALREQSTEVLAVPSAGALIARDLWDELGGYDRDYALLREDLDFGWRANQAGKTVLCVPLARLRHARALANDERPAPAMDRSGLTAPTVRAVDRAYGLRTFLVNCSRFSYLVGLPRLVVLCVLRGIGFALIREGERARAEFASLSYLLGGHGGLKAARASRAADTARLLSQRDGSAADKYGSGSSVRGLFIGRFTRLRLALGSGVRYLVRRRVASDAALGTLPESVAARSSWVPPAELRAAAFAGGQTKDVVAVALSDDVALPAIEGDSTEVGAGTEVAEPLAEAADGTEAAAPPVGPPRPRPTPGAGAAASGLVFVEVNRKRILAATLFAPPLLLVLALTGLALLINSSRLGLDLAGGRLLPVENLGQVWSAYLSGWHPASGGTSTHAPAALSVLGVLGVLAYPLGGPAAAVALLLLLDIPLATLSAYAATRRLPVHRWTRAALAVVYALLPPATAAVAQGRLDVVVVHLLLPLVLAGVVTVLRPRDAGRRWLSASVTLALGIAVLGAFSPLLHLLVLIGLLAGFVLVHSTAAIGRRIAGVAVVVLLPIALLLPWPTTLIEHPELALHGIGARVPELRVSAGELFSLDPGGAGTLPLGALLIVAVVIGLVVRPTLRVFTGAGIAALGVAGVAVVQLIALSPISGGAPRQGWTGAPLLVVGAGLLLMLLAIVRTERVGAHAVPQGRGMRLLAVGAGLAVLVVFTAGAVLAGGDGPLGPTGARRMAAPLAAELASNGRSVLELRTDGDPPRVAGGGVPAFGDDDLAAPGDTPSSLLGWQSVLVGAPGAPPGPPQAVRDTLARASAAGVQFIVLPPGVDPGWVLQGGGELVITAAPMADGRQVLRLKPVNGQVTLIAPELSRLAVDGEPPTGDIEGEGVSVVDAVLPDVRVRVSDGPGGRLLVLAANLEAGWRASVNGKPVPIVPAWGHQVGVEVPTRAADVVVDNPKTVRTTLLLVQVGAVLFTLLTAIPARHSRRGTAAGRGR